MVQKSTITNYLYYFGVIVICGIYLLLRLSYQDTIEFGYDQPKLASTILEFISKPTLLDSVKFVSENAWGIPSWGITQIFFYCLFFVFSKDPLTISLSVGMFNLLSVLGVIFLGSKYISKTAGIVAGLLLATQPWWYIFSRMIYQPTPVIVFTLVSILKITIIQMGV